MANTNRTKGNDAERLYARLFRELGFTFCKTSRQTSRMMDDAGIDLNFLPFNVQIKMGHHKGINPAKVLHIIDERLPTMFPPNDPIHKKLNVLIHRNQIGLGKKRVPTDDLVYVSKYDFVMHLLDSPAIKNYKVIDIIKQGNKRGWTEKSAIEEGGEGDIKLLFHTKKSKATTKYDHLVIFSFEDFTKIIKTIKWD